MPIGPALALLALVILLGLLAACHFFQGRRHKDHASRRGPDWESLCHVEHISRAGCYVPGDSLYATTTVRPELYFAGCRKNRFECGPRMCCYRRSLSH